AEPRPRQGTLVVVALLIGQRDLLLAVVTPEEAAAGQDFVDRQRPDQVHDEKDEEHFRRRPRRRGGRPGVGRPRIEGRRRDGGALLNPLRVGHAAVRGWWRRGRRTVS